MKLALRIVVPLLVSLLALFLATRNVHWDQLLNILSGCRWGPLALGVVISLWSFVVRAYRWKLLLQPFQNISSFVLLRWHIGGLLISNLFPLRMGEFARAYWAGHKSSIPKTTIFATIVIERVMDVASLFLIGVTLMFLLGFYKSGGRALPIVIGGIVLIAAAAFGARFLLSAPRREAIRAKLKSVLPEKIYGMLNTFLNGLRILKDKDEVVKVASLSILIWCSDITVIYTMARSIDFNISWMQAGFTMAGLVLGVMVPAAPGAAGTYEAGGVGALALMGFERTISFSYVFLIHTVQYLAVLVIGVPVLMAEGFSFKKLYRNMEQETQTQTERV